MGMPTIPDIKPHIDITLDETIRLLLASVAMEELSLAHIMNAEAEKVQEIIHGGRGIDIDISISGNNKLDDLLSIDKSVERIMRDVIKKEMLLEFKFENILELMDKNSHKPHDCKD